MFRCVMTSPLRSSSAKARCMVFGLTLASAAKLFHMSLTVPRGRIIGLLGPNGCGKTTLIKMINGLLAPTSGTVYINGMFPGAESKRVICISSVYLTCIYLPEISVHRLILLISDSVYRGVKHKRAVFHKNHIIKHILNIGN